jgi:hypothetical protein
LAEKYFKKLFGITNVEDALQRLDKWTLEEACMAQAEILKITHRIDENVIHVGENVEGVNEGMQHVRVKVEDINDQLQTVHTNVQGVGHEVGLINKGDLFSSPRIRPQLYSAVRCNGGHRRDTTGV